MTHTLHDGDVFRFSYNEAARARLSPHFIDHCFDGQLVYEGGTFWDTYWGLKHRGWDVGRRFTLAEAERDGTLTFVCNLNDVERIPEGDFKLYAKGYAFDLSHHRGHNRYYVKAKGATKDVQLMRDAAYKLVVDAKEEHERTMRLLIAAVIRREELMKRIEAGQEVSI